MPFIVDLPPKPAHEINTKIENIIDIGQLDHFDKQALELDRDLLKDIYLSEKFKGLVEAWESSIAFESSILKIIEDSNFKEIIKMGNKAIPLIIDELEKKPSILVWALNIITNTSLNSKQRPTIDSISKAWVRYYREGKIKYN